MAHMYIVTAISTNNYSSSDRKLTMDCRMVCITMSDMLDRTSFLPFDKLKEGLLVARPGINNLSRDSLIFEGKLNTLSEKNYETLCFY